LNRRWILVWRSCAGLAGGTEDGVASSLLDLTARMQRPDVHDQALRVQVNRQETDGEEAVGVDAEVSGESTGCEG
jgi:hypothetical protein